MWHTDFGALVLSVYVLDRYGRNRDVVLGYLREAIKLFWTFRVPWRWTYTAGTVADWVAQFSFGFYSLMLTSMLLGLIVMVLYKPRTWCTFCTTGTMTQGIFVQYGITLDDDVTEVRNGGFGSTTKKK